MIVRESTDLFLDRMLSARVAKRAAELPATISIRLSYTCFGTQSNQNMWLVIFTLFAGNEGIIHHHGCLSQDNDAGSIFDTLISRSLLQRCSLAQKSLLGLTPTAILFGYTRSVPERLRQRGVNELAQDSKRRRWNSNP